MENHFSDMIKSPDRGCIKMALIGTQPIIIRMIHKLFSDGVADPNDWSPPQAIKDSDQFISLLIKRI